MTAWVLAVDVGTTATAAAIGTGGERRTIELDGRSRMPSTVLARPDGALVVGDAAEAQAALDPERVERTPKRRLGDPVLLLGDQAIDPVDAIAAILEHVASTASAGMAGTAPDQLVLTHPAAWGSGRCDLLTEAARRADLPAPRLVAEPVAAAAHLATDVAGPDDVLAVYDLGGGTFDAALVRRTDTGFVVAGPPGGDESLGGEALDELVVRFVLGGLDPAVAEQLATSEDRIWRQARWQLRREARTAKEALSTSESYRWYLGPPVDAEVALTSAELEELVRGPIVASARSLVDTVRRAGLAPQHLAPVVMVGGCARAPIVGQVLTQAIGRPPTTWGDPKAAVSLGALRAASEMPHAAGTRPAPSPPAPAARLVTPAPEPADPGPAEPPTAAPAPEPAPIERAGATVEARVEAPLLDAADHAAGPRWDRQQIGTAVAITLVLLGVVFAVLAYVAD